MFQSKYWQYLDHSIQITFSVLTTLALPCLLDPSKYFESQRVTETTRRSQFKSKTSNLGINGDRSGNFRVNQIFLMDSFSPSDERLIVWGPGVKRTTTWYNKYWIWNIQFSYEVWHVCQRDHWIECKTNVPNFLSFCLPFHISLRLFLGLRPNPASGDYLLLEGWGRFKLRLKNQSRDYFYIKLGIFEVWNDHKLKS